MQNQVQLVSSFEALIECSFQGEVNAICWKRDLSGDFSELINQLELSENMRELEPEDLLALDLSEAGKQARAILLQDLQRLKAHGAAPVLNLIQSYERDHSFPFFPRDVYSFHVDRSPIPSETFLCTYHGEASEIIANAEAKQKILIPEIRAQLREVFEGDDEGFDAFLSENFFDLHYQVLENTQATSLGIGNLWKLAIEHPESAVAPCVHRAPLEKVGEKRLLLIC
ncbi:MAG: DUF1826 domain-containing protein [Chitinophagales bacterium]|nr:DUF1826 domain-containing protein [Chitinophagales bacterium]